MKKLLTGDEAIARGLYEAGVSFASAYPGTPSTEILENVAKYDDMYAEWAPNEKVAMEAAIGASMSGVRSFAAMKMVGVNVAADPLFTFTYLAINGGFAFVSADDQGCIRLRMNRITAIMPSLPKSPCSSRRIRRNVST